MTGAAHRVGRGLPSLLLAAFLLIPGCATQSGTGTSAAENDPRSSKWADPIPGYAGLPNLYRVSGGLYRGAQPSRAEGYAALSDLGIKIVVNLRGGHDEEELVREHGLDYVYIPMKAWKFDEEDVIRFLRVVALADHHPVFVHCRRGADRTGMAIAVYRVVFEDWSKEDALFEMIDGPYDYNPRWKKLVRFVMEMDVEELRREAGVATAPVTESRSTIPD